MSTVKAKVCYLHIGAEKTGSTSIQAFLKANRKLLLEHDCLFPRTPGDENQPALAAYAQKDTSRVNLMELAGVHSAAGLEDLRQTMREGLAREIAAARPDSVVLTNEHCHSRIEKPHEVERLAELLLSIAEEVRIIFYVRRQDMAATSLYSTALKMGQSRRLPAMKLEGPLPIGFDYWRTCELYGEVFGFENLNVRLFDPAHFKGGDLIADFCACIDIEDETEWVRLPSSNKSIGQLGQRFLSAFNGDRRERFGKDADHYRNALVRMLDRHFAGKGVKPPRSLAKAFFDRFAEGNEALRQRYFPEVPAPLFGEDFSMYPDAEKPWMPGIFLAFDIGARLFIEQQKEIDRLKVELETVKRRKRD